MVPQRRHAQNASAAPRIFTRHPKKTFATISRVRRTCRASRNTSILGPKADFKTSLRCGNNDRLDAAGLARIARFPPTDLSLQDLSLQHEWGLRWAYGTNSCSHAAIFAFPA